MPGTLFVVATPIGNLEDITTRAVRVLREAAVIAAEDTRRTAHLLARYAIATPTTSLREHNEASRTEDLLARLVRGDAVALVSDAGTPTVSDPGALLIRRAIETGIRVEAVPGPSAVMAAIAVSGFPSDTFMFLGFPPIRSTDRSTWLQRLAAAGCTVVFFEAPHRVRETLGQIRDTAGDCTVLVGRELTKKHEELVRGPISSVLAGLSKPRGEFTVVVDIGHKPESGGSEAVDDETLRHEFAAMMVAPGLPKRQAINALARKHRRPPNEVYAAIERAKKLVERQK